MECNTSGLPGGEPSSLHLVWSSLYLFVAGGPWSQESSKPCCYLYRLFCSILLISLEPLTCALSPHTQNKDPWENRHIWEQLRDPKAPDFGKIRCKAKATHLRWSSECSTTQNTKSKTVEHCFFLNYRWAALTTKETQEELVSGSNRKHLHNMHGAFSASRRCWMKSPTGWGSPLSVGV